MKKMIFILSFLIFQFVYADNFMNLEIDADACLELDSSMNISINYSYNGRQGEITAQAHCDHFFAKEFEIADGLPCTVYADMCTDDLISDNVNIVCKNGWIIEKAYSCPEIKK